MTNSVTDKMEENIVENKKKHFTFNIIKIYNCLVNINFIIL